MDGLFVLDEGQGSVERSIAVRVKRCGAGEVSLRPVIAQAIRASPMSKTAHKVFKPSQSSAGAAHHKVVFKNYEST